LEKNLDEIHRTFPDTPIVISEYGWCACTDDRPEGDGKRIAVLREHTQLFRKKPYVAGLIFFCYNDYRTHIGDKGRGVMKQRVHGVVDLYGSRKRSFDQLREESSPLAELSITGDLRAVKARAVTRDRIPAYTLRDYTLRWVVYGYGNIPLERYETSLPDMAPGDHYETGLDFEEPRPWKIEVDVRRPDGQSVTSRTWVA
jgi:beta-glucuronidase